MVDTDATAQRVLDVMLREKTGRVTFMPLNRLHPKDQVFPPGGDAIPLLSKLTYDAAVGKAMQQVFGRTAVCRDLAVAAAYVRSHGLNTITLDGDKVDRKGALTGGWHDVRRSRIDAVRGVRSWGEKHEAESMRLKEVRERAAKLDQEVTACNGRAAVLGNELAKLAARKDADAVAWERAEAEKAHERARRADSERAEVEAELEALRAKVDAYRTEMGTEMVKRLTADEERALEALGKEVEERKVELAELRKERTDVSWSISFRAVLTRRPGWRTPRDGRD